MPRQRKYRLHKGSGQAVVQIDGKIHYLGKYDSPKSWEKYHRLLAERAIRKPPTVEGPEPVTVAQLLALFWEHVKGRYTKNGKRTTEVGNYKLALRLLRQHYGSFAVDDFKPLCLVALRQKLVDAGYCRKQINGRVNRMRRAFKWGVTMQVVKPETWYALRAVECLRIGEARDNPKVKPVNDAAIDAVKPFVSPQVWALVCFQRWTGCRPGEACVLRRCDIETSGPVWEYRPHVHKLQHMEITRVVYIGPHGQAVLAPWLRPELETYLFQPAEGRAAYLASIRKRPGSRASTRVFARHYTPQVYCAAIKRACQAAGVPAWSPNQLRHAAATRIRKEFGLELARVVLGHSSAVTTEGYAEADLEKSREIMRRIG